MPQKSDNSALFRQWILLKILPARRLGASVESLAAEASVSVKTIRRDLLLFQELGFPLEEFRAGHGKKIWKLSGQSGPSLSFNLDEALALYLARRLFEPLHDTLLWQSLEAAITKIRSTLNETALEYVENMLGRIRPAPLASSNYAAKAEIVDRLMIGIEDHKIVHITYRSVRATEAATRDVYPHGVVAHRGSLYLIAFAPEHDEIRRYKIDRIDNIEVSDFRFEQRANFDLDLHLAGSFAIYTGNEPVGIKVRFARAVARYIQEKTWPGCKATTRQSTDDIVLEFELNATAEFKSWILSFGPLAEILEPGFLRNEIAADLLAAGGQYAIARNQESNSNPSRAFVEQP